jgi:type 1 fimbriae regulatory protein FimB/type 1 fimbriae regulatory protein FimE
MSVSWSQTQKTDISEKREWLYAHEVDSMVAAVRKSGSKHADRDALLVLLSYRHGLRSCEAATLTWNDINMVGRQYNLIIRRAKHRGTEFSTYNHPLVEEEIRAIKRLQSVAGNTPYVFGSQKGSALDTRSIRRIVKEAGELANLPFEVHPHMLRHATGYELANKGTDTRAIQEYLGHKNIQSTTRYTKLAANRFNDLVKLL